MFALFFQLAPESLFGDLGQHYQKGLCLFFPPRNRFFMGDLSKQSQRRVINIKRIYICAPEGQIDSMQRKLLF